MEEHEIDLIDIFWRVLFQWRKLLICGIIGAILLIGAKIGISVYQNETRFIYTGEESVNEIKHSLKLDEIPVVEYLLDMYEQVDQDEKILRESAKYKVDAYNLKTLSLKYRLDIKNISLLDINDVQTDAATAYSIYANEVSSAIVGLANNNVLFQEVFKEVSGSVTETDYDSLISFWSSSNVIINVQVILFDGMTEEHVEKAVLKYLEKITAEYDGQVSLSVHALDKNVFFATNQDLAKERADLAKKIYDEKIIVQTIRNSLSEEQEDYVNKVRIIRDGELGKGQDVPTLGIGSIVKSGILGLFLGVIAVAGIVALKCLFCGKLMQRDQLKDMEVLGIMERKENKQNYRGLDKKLHQWHRRDIVSRTADQKLKATETAIAIACEQHNTNSLCVSGTSLSMVDNNCVQTLINSLQKRGIEITLVDNIYYDAEALGRCAAVGFVVFIEQINKSILNEIKHERARATQMNIHELGVVLLDE